MGAVAGIGKDVRTHVGDPLDIRCPRRGCRFVELARDHQRRRGDPVQPVDDAPAPQCAEDVKLVGPVHGVVDRRLGFHLGLGVDEVLRSGGHAADVADVELLRRREVLRIGDGACGLVSVQRGLGLLGQLRPKLGGGGHPQRHGGRRVADRQRRESGRLPHGDFGAEHPAPGLPEHVVLVDAECVAHRVELRDEQIGRPEVDRCVGQVSAVAASELVVVDDRAPGFVGQLGDVAHVVVRHAGAAVQH
jgi:hypothetical protein